ncbi:MAG: galactokinase [Verrucomicrobia bacterium]|nr:galactokinase [Verrucomicrobiota bacterium]
MIESNIALSQLASETAQKFQQLYGRPPRWMAAAPGRVNIIGEHTDYNDGFVFPMAIERYTVIAADRPASPGASQVNWHCARTNQTAHFPLTKPVPKGDSKHWTNYIRGVFAGFQNRGIETGPLDALMTSNVPLGGGLSSSAALEVGTATLIETVTGQKIDPVEKALLCQKAEHDYAGMPCGIMDQFISALGQKDKILLLDCRSRQTELVPISDPAIEVLIINTNVKHELTGGGYAQRRKQCEEAARLLGVASLRDATAALLEDNKSKLEPVVFRRAAHVISEIERTVHAAAGIRVSNWPTVGALMYASHYSLKDNYEVSCLELDVVVEIAQEIGASGGVVGCRMTGGGFGGCAVALVRSDKIQAIAAKIATDYEQRTKIKPSLFVSRPAAGATVLKG